jgi:TPR repeat protein
MVMATFEMDGAAMAPRAEARPDAERLFDLGVLYATGRDVEQNFVAAHKWFNLAAVGGYRDAAFHRQLVAGEMSAKEIAEAQRAAREWLRLHGRH